MAEKKPTPTDPDREAQLGALHFGCTLPIYAGYPTPLLSSRLDRGTAAEMSSPAVRGVACIPQGGLSQKDEID